MSFGGWRHQGAARGREAVRRRQLLTKRSGRGRGATCAHQSRARQQAGRGEHTEGQFSKEGQVLYKRQGICWGCKRRNFDQHVLRNLPRRLRRFPQFCFWVFAASLDNISDVLFTLFHFIIFIIIIFFLLKNSTC